MSRAPSAAQRTTGTAERLTTGDFRSRAACRDGIDPDAFFPTGEAGPQLDAAVAAAKAVCAGCPVRAACLAWALRALPYGIAGGLTAEERRDLRARHAPRVRTHRELTCPPGAARPEVAAAGRAAIQAGHDVREVAAEFGVSERTAVRWAAQVRATNSSAAEARNATPIGAGLPACAIRPTTARAPEGGRGQ